MKILMIVLLLQGIPEGMALTSLAFTICRIPLKLNQIMFIGISLAVSAYLIRLFPIPFGTHTILIMLLLFIILTRFSKNDDVGLPFLGSLLSFLVLIVFETVSLPLMKLISCQAITTVSPYHVVKIILGNVHVLLMFVTTFALKAVLNKEEQLFS